MIEMKKFFRVQPIIYVTGMISLFTDLSSQMIVPLLPLFLTSVLHAQVASIGLIEGVATCASNVLKLFSGWLSDRIGKRKALMVIGYGLSNIIKPLFAFSESWGQVFALRFAERIGKGIRGAPRDALIADSTTKEERGRAFGFHRTMDTLGAALGPLIAFIILSVHPGDYRMVFWVSAIPGILGILVVVIYLKEKDQTLQKEKKQLPKITFTGFNPRLVRFTLVATLFAIGNSSDAFLVLRAQSVGMTVAMIPLAYFAFNLTYSLTSAPIGALSDKIGRRAVVVSGYVIFALIYFGFGIANSVAWIWILFVIYGLYYAATEGIQKAYIGDLVKQGQRGTAMGTFNALTGFATLPASILPGYLWQVFGPTVAFGYSTVIALMAAILMIILKV
jgi:MFS family permease